MTHDELVCIGRDWLSRPFAAGASYGHSGCGVVITELSASTWGGEIPDVLGFTGKKSILIECKTSRSDYRMDSKKMFRKYPEMGVGSQRWFMAPVGVIPKDSVPAKWGLLEVTSGGSVLVIVPAEIQRRNQDSEIAILLSTMRRLNIQDDGHIGIKKYKPIFKHTSSKKRATVVIEPEDVDEDN